MKMFWCFFVATLGGLLASSSVALSQESVTTPPPDDGIFLNIGNAGTRRIKLAIPVMAAGQTPSASALDTDIINRFRRLFDFTMSFDIASNESLPTSAGAYAVPIGYDSWKALGFELVLQGSVAGAADGVRTMEFRLYDVQKGKRLLGKRFSQVSSTNLDEVIKRFADLAIQSLTGQMGIFSTRIAFVGAARKGDPKEVYICDFDGQNLVQVTREGKPHMSPAWSPDGTKIAYTSFKNGRAEIHLYNLLTRKSYKLSQGEGNVSGANWHPDGQTMAFSQSLKGQTSIYTMRSFDGGGIKTLVTGSGLEVEPAYSPGGKLLAFASGRFGNPHIFVRDLLSGKDTRITFAGWYNSSPSWRPDGKKLAFAGYDREIDRYDIFNVDQDGRLLERLTLDRGDNEKPSYSPDGRFILFQSNRRDDDVRGKQNTYRLFIMTKDGAGQRPLNIALADVSMPEWSPYLTGL